MLRNKKPLGLVFEERIKRLFKSLDFKIISVEDFVGHPIRFRKFLPDFFVKGVKPPFEILALVECKYYKGKVPTQAVYDVSYVLEQYPRANKAVIVSSFGFTSEAIEIASSSEHRNRLILTTEAELLKRLPEHMQEEFKMEYANSALYSKDLESSFIAYTSQRNIPRLLGEVPRERLEAIIRERIGDDKLLQDIPFYFGEGALHKMISRSSVRELSDFVVNRQEEMIQAIMPEKDRLKKIYLKSKLEKDPNKKGKLLERVVAGLINLVDDLRVHKANVLTDKEEIDLLVRNQSKEEPWTNLGPMIFVECKNWSRPVGSSEVSSFRTKLRDHRAETGIFVAVNGITGRGSFQAAKGQIRDAWKIDHKSIFVLQGKDVDSVLKCTNLTDLMEEQFCEFWEM